MNVPLWGLLKTADFCRQWRRQDLLRGEAKLEIRSWGTDGRTSGPAAAAARWLSFITNAVQIKRAVALACCWHLHQLISQTTQHLDNWQSDLLQSELKMKLLEVEGARAPVPHSWRRHCLSSVSTYRYAKHTTEKQKIDVL